MGMNRIDKIINNEEYRRLVAETEELEKERIFCHHDMDHFLDVARIATMIAADEDMDVPRDMIYAAALLHDIGRVKQYTEDFPHESASAAIAPSILCECDFTAGEIKEITKAIREHGNEAVKGERNLAGLLYRADKLSRKCYMCAAVDKCHKSPEKLVMSIEY